MKENNLANTQIVATEIAVDDLLEVEGWMLHEDLSGLKAEVKVLSVEIDGNWIGVEHKPLGTNNTVKTWFKTDETVRLLSRAS